MNDEIKQPESPDKQEPTEGTEFQEQATASPKAKAKTGKPKRSWKRRILWTMLTIFVALILLVALAPTIASSGVGESIIANVASGALNRTVSIGDLSIGWGGGLKLDNLEIKEQDDRPFASVKGIAGAFKIFPLISGNVYVENLDIVEPKLFLRRDKDGKLNIDDLIAEPEPETPGKPASTTKKPATKPAPAATFTLPNIEFRGSIKNAQFTFTDDSLGETVEIKNLTAELNVPSINDEVDFSVVGQLLAKGQNESIELNGKVKIAENNAIDPAKVKGSVEFITSALKANASFDLAKFDSTEDATGAELTIDGDLGKLAGQIGAIVGLPEGLNVAGTIHSELSGTGRLDSAITISGKSDINDLSLSGGPLAAQPVEQKLIRTTQKMTLTMKEQLPDRLDIEDVSLIINAGNIGMKGAVTELSTAEPKVNAEMILFMNLVRIKEDFGGLILPEGMHMEGVIRANSAVAGTIATPHISGTARLLKLAADLPPELVYGEPIDAEAAAEEAATPPGPVHIGPISTDVAYDLTYDTMADLLEVKQLNMQSDFFTCTSSGQVTALTQAVPVLDYQLAANGDLARLDAVLADLLPPEVTMGGGYEFEMKIQGPLMTTTPEATGGDKQQQAAIENPYEMLTGITAEGKANFANVRYASMGSEATLSEINAKQIELKDGAFNMKADLKINEGPSVATSTVDFNDPDTAYQFSAEGSKVNIDSKVRLIGWIIPLAIVPDDGKINTKADFKMAGQGKGLEWDVMSRNLNVDGQLTLGEGSVEGGEIIGGLLQLAKQKDRFEFDNIATAFGIKDGKINNDEIKVQGKALSFVLSGWTSLTPEQETGGYPMEYTVGKELLQYYLSEELAQYGNLLGGLGTEYSPLLIAGTVQKPKVSLNLPDLQDTAKDLLGGALNNLFKKKIDKIQ